MNLLFKLTQAFNVILNNHVVKHVDLGQKAELRNDTHEKESINLLLKNATTKTRRSVDVNYTTPHISNSSLTTKAITDKLRVNG